MDLLKNQPILPDNRDTLLEYLLHPENLPIHDFKRGQLLWPRQTDIKSLLTFDNSPLATSLKVARDPFTGLITGFNEVEIDQVGLTSKNSTALNRAPDPLSEHTRGSSSNYPFWPGGFPNPIADLPTDESIDFTKDILTIPPGFSRGLEFHDDGFTLIDSSNEQSDISNTSNVVINLLSSTQYENDLADLWSEPTENVVDEEKPSEEIKEITVDDSGVIPTEESIAILKITETDKIQSVKQSQWAEIINVNLPVTDFEKRIPDLAHKYNFELDTFQKQAILKLEEHSNVFVAAHTSAGKTVVAEYAIALSKRHMTRTIYTSPIKALSNQKYRDFKYTFKDVGLITGDFQINQTASCLIMTTEILRSMLYCGSDVTRDLEYVIFDEVHYINDSDRGHVWEEVIILLPSHVTIVMLSATVPNTLEFADWVGCAKQRKVYVISTPKRPVPLLHYLYTGHGGKSKNDRFLILDAEGKFQLKGYEEASLSKKAASKKEYAKVGAKHHLNPKQEQTMWIGLIDHLKAKDKLPVVAFTLSRKRCDLNAEALSSVDLNDSKEKHQVFRFFQQCIQRLKEPDQKLPQIVLMRSWLDRGIGVHHSGILPILKEIVEMLFQKGLVKILFATETFAMGVNMPTKTVIFDSVVKYDGKISRDLLPAEYIQMAGRAGRRGLDDVGTVIILCKTDVPKIETLKAMMLGKPEKLTSQFRLTYNMLLKLLRIETLSVESMMSHSFREVGHKLRATQLENELKNTQMKIDSLNVEINECLQKLCLFYTAASAYLNYRKEIWPTVIEKWGTKDLIPGRLLIISHEMHYNKLAMILKISPGKQIKYIVLALDNISNKVDTNKPNEYYKMLALRNPNEIFTSENIGGHVVLHITAIDIFHVLGKVVKFDFDLIVSNWEKRQIVRFQNDPPGATCTQAVQELTKISHTFSSSNNAIPLLNIKVDWKIRDISLLPELDHLDMLYQKVTEVVPYTKIANFEKSFDEIFHKMFLNDQKKHLEFLVSHQSMSLYPEYQCRLGVLSELGYVDDQYRVKLKGRVACEIGTHDLIVTELVFRNILTDLKPEEVAALLSCLVFQVKIEYEPKLTKTLIEGRKKIEEIEMEIHELEKRHGISGEDHLVNSNKLNFGLVEVVYEWALQKPFAEIMELTDIQEGIIVKCIQKLNECLRGVKDAARIIGDPQLQAKMDEAANIIKRDIVFAASLYTQQD